jgi:hypothetical protein
MPAPKLNPEFVVTIKQRNERGETTGEKQFVLFAGLLALAHELGLEEIDTALVQVPAEENQRTAIVRAVVKGKPGSYAGIGDASPANTNRRVAQHLIRVAETRAKARALRDFTNVNLVAFEELGDDVEDDRFESPPAPAARIHAARAAANDAPRKALPATEPQKRALFRRAYELGYEGHDAAGFIAQRLGVEVERATKEQASKLLDALVREQRANGGDHAAE